MVPPDQFFPGARSVRSASRALIIDDRRLLAIKMKRPREREEFFILPGGGQRHGETLVQSLLRECREELGFEPIVGTVAYVREYIGKNHTFANNHRNFHQVEVVFYCQLPDGVTVNPRHSGDKNQIGVAWIPLADLPRMNFYPERILEFVGPDNIKVDPLYLGDIN